MKPCFNLCRILCTKSTQQYAVIYEDFRRVCLEISIVVDDGDDDDAHGSNALKLYATFSLH